VEQVQVVAEQGKSEQQQPNEERSELVAYAVKLPNGVKFTRLNPVNHQ
jgi:hypothetical protein